ncbi:M18 family aminopeptidase [Gammaproteobacteria bacterium]|nr:M18 family aminopeptidase [Gammaproteobacteria bacterium]
MLESINLLAAAERTPSFSDEAFVDDLLMFLDESPSPWHACQAMARRLDAAGFVERDECQAGADDSSTYIRRNGSSLIAWAGAKHANRGLRMVGAHTDSPGLRLKPHADLIRDGYQQWSVEVYGGALLRPWFDRELALAGRVVVRDTKGTLQTQLIHIADPLAIIPSLAIHLDREANKGGEINAQRHMFPLIGLDGDDISLDSLLQAHLQREHGMIDAQIVSHELLLVDCQRAARIGVKRDWVASARLDNLLSCYVGLQALINAGEGEHCQLLVASDHEEVGSQSASGAAGPFLQDTLQRLCGASLPDALRQSLLVSADNAHARHPNFPDKHDPNHSPLLNRGPVIKHNANQRYASNAETVAVFQSLCGALEEPLQHIAMRADMACGSTIGPITATLLGVATVDVGIPQLAMHSPRELAGIADCRSLARALSACFLT